MNGQAADDEERLSSEIIMDTLYSEVGRTIIVELDGCYSLIIFH